MVLEAIFPLFFKLFRMFLVRQTKICKLGWMNSEWAGLLLILVFGPVDGFFGPFLLMCCLPWTTGVVGLWTPGGSLRCWIWSTVD
jgi:hypothetical protein